MNYSLTFWGEIGPLDLHFKYIKKIWIRNTSRAKKLHRPIDSIDGIDTMHGSLGIGHWIGQCVLVSLRR
jgi:hypothetical protein